MTKPLSNDLRERVVVTVAEIAATIHVHSTLSERSACLSLFNVECPL